MRRITMAVALAAAASALCTVAVSAMAREFTASRLPKPFSEAEPGKTRGFGIGATELGDEVRNQELKFGAFRMFCAVRTNGNTIPEGAISWSTSPIFATEVRFEKCLTKATYGGFTAGTPTSFNVNPETKKSEPVKFVYHVNGFLELGSGEVESEVEVGSGTTSFSIAGKICKIVWPRQTVPAKAAVKPEEVFSAVTYSNHEVAVEEKKLKQFPSGFKTKLVIHNNFKTMAWHYEEGQCLGEGGFEEGAKQTEAKTGVYKGLLEEEVGNGNLGFRE